MLPAASAMRTISSTPVQAMTSYTEKAATTRSMPVLATTSSTAGSGNDIMVAGDGTDTMYGEDGNDQMTGGNGLDWLLGGNGDDVMDGGADADYLWGGNGNDTMTGGTGVDRFWFRGTFGRDTITDYDAAELLDVRTTGVGYGDLQFANVSGNLEISAAGWGAGNTIVLEGVTDTSIAEAAFLF